MTWDGTPLGDTGWFTLPLVGGFTAVSGETPQYRREGNKVYMRGRISGTYGTSLTACASLPAGFRPVQGETVWIAGTSITANPARLAIDDAGSIRAGLQSAATLQVSVHGFFFIN